MLIDKDCVHCKPLSTSIFAHAQTSSRQASNPGHARNQPEYASYWHAKRARKPHIRQPIGYQPRRKRDRNAKRARIRARKEAEEAAAAALAATTVATAHTVLDEMEGTRAVSCLPGGLEESIFAGQYGYSVAGGWCTPWAGH